MTWWRVGSVVYEIHGVLQVKVAWWGNAFSVRNLPSIHLSIRPSIHPSVRPSWLCVKQVLCHFGLLSLSGVKLHIHTTQEKGPKFPKELSAFNQGEENN